MQEPQTMTVSLEIKFPAVSSTTLFEDSVWETILLFPSAMTMTLYQVYLMFSINSIQLCKCFRETVECFSTTVSEAQSLKGLT